MLVSPLMAASFCGILRAGLAGLFVLRAAAFGEEPAPKQFTATAEMTTSQGTRSMPLTVVINRPISAEEALPLRKALESGGQQALLAAIQGGNRGRLSLGSLEYPLDLVVAEPVSGGLRYAVVTTRSLRVEEVNEGRPSLDYPFTVAVFDVPEFGSGQGELYPRAALSIDADGRVRIERYDERPGLLKNIRRR